MTIADPVRLVDITLPSGITMATTLSASQAYIGRVGTETCVTPPVEISRPAGALAYTVNQRVGPSAASDDPTEITGLALAAGGSGAIVGVRLTTDKISVTPRFRIHFFNASTPTLAVDGVNWREAYADASLRVGWVDMPAMESPIDTVNSDLSRSQNFSIYMAYKCAAASTSLWFALQTLDAFNAAATEKFSLVIKAILF